MCSCSGRSITAIKFNFPTRDGKVKKKPLRIMPKKMNPLRERVGLPDIIKYVYSENY